MTYRRCVCSLWGNNEMLLCLGMHLVTKRWVCRSIKENFQIYREFTELQKHTSYTDTVVFVEREIMLTFINKVRNLVLLS